MVRSKILQSAHGLLHLLLIIGDKEMSSHLSRAQTLKPRRRMLHRLTFAEEPHLKIDTSEAISSNELNSLLNLQSARRTVEGHQLESRSSSFLRFRVETHVKFLPSFLRFGLISIPADPADPSIMSISRWPVLQTTQTPNPATGPWHPLPRDVPKLSTA